MIYSICMSHCKTYIVLAGLLGLACGYGISCLSCSDSSKSPVYQFEKDSAAKGVEAIRSLPPVCRAAIIGSRCGFFYTPGGGSAYANNEQYSGAERVQYFAVGHAAHFVDFEGKEHRFYDVIRTRDKEGNHKQTWIKAMQYIGNSTDEAIFSALSDEVIQLAQQAAKRHLNSLSKEFRTAWLAEQAGLLYQADGQNFYTGEVQRKRIPGTHVELITRLTNNNVFYNDAKGKKQNFNDIKRKLQQNFRARSAWEYASYCATIVGAEPILALYEDDVNTLRKVSGSK